MDKKKQLPQLFSDQHIFCLISFSAAQISYSNCGGSAVDLTSLTITPSSISLGENITLSFDGQITETIDTTNAGKVEVSVKKQILGVWTDIPCIDGVGSCTYDDFCSLFGSGSCGPILNGANIPCACPFNAGSYSLNPTVLYLPDDSSIPKWLTTGNYQAQGTLYDQSGNVLTCYSVQVTLA